MSNGCEVSGTCCTSDCSISGAKQCSGNGYQTCGNYDADSCLEWSSVTACGQYQQCTNGACVNKIAQLSNIAFSDVTYQYSGGNHYYYHKRIITENNGVPVYLTYGKLSYQSGGFREATVDYTVNGILTLLNQNFYTSYSSEVFTVRYCGNDYNNNYVCTEGTMTVQGSTHNP